MMSGPAALSTGLEAPGLRDLRQGRLAPGTRGVARSIRPWRLASSAATFCCCGLRVRQRSPSEV